MEMALSQTRPLRRPVPAEPVEPGVGCLQPDRINGVEPARALGPNSGEARLPQHAQMLGNRRLGDPELGLHHLTDRPGGKLTFGEQFEDPPPDGFAEDVERMHGPSIAFAFI